MHVVNDELISKEGILLVLTSEVLDWYQHFSDLLEDIVLFVDSFIYHHLIGLVRRKQQSLEPCQLVNVSGCILTNTCGVHFSRLFWVISDTGVTFSTVFEENVIWNNSNVVTINAIKVFWTGKSRILTEFSILSDVEHFQIAQES